VADCGGRLSLKSAMMVALDLVAIFQYFHFKYYVYSNLHPRHVLLGKGEKYAQLFLVDYSRATRFKDAQTSEHVPMPQDKPVEMRTHNL
jgi:casein kinase I homolog HRR25